MHGRQESAVLNATSHYRRTEEYRTKVSRERLQAFQNPRPPVAVLISETGSALVERLKQRTRSRIGKSIGTPVLSLREGKDAIIYPPYVVLLELFVRPFTERVAVRKEKIITMLFQPEMTEESLRLYGSMSPWEQRHYEDRFHGVPT